MSKRISNQFLCSSMMLPEHREEIETMNRDREKKPPPPEWDEQALELWERLLKQSFKQGEKIKITVFLQDRYLEVAGVVQRLDVSRGRVGIETAAGYKVLELKTICAVEAANSSFPG